MGRRAPSMGWGLGRGVQVCRDGCGEEPRAVLGCGQGWSRSLPLLEHRQVSLNVLPVQ